MPTLEEEYELGIPVDEERGTKYLAPSTGLEEEYNSGVPVEFEKSKSDYAEPTKSIPERIIRGGIGNVVDLFKMAGTVATQYPKTLYDVGIGVKDVLTSDKSMGQVGREFIDKRLPVQMVKGLYGGATKGIDYLQNKVGSGVEGLVETGKDIANWAIDNPVDVAMLGLPIVGSTGKALKAAGMTKTGGFMEALGVEAPQYLGRKISQAANTKAFLPLGTQLNNAIDTGVAKSLRVKGSKMGNLERDIIDSREGVKQIVANKENLSLTNELGETVTKLPENRLEHLSAVRKTMDDKISQLETMEQKAGNVVPTVDYDSLIQTLSKKAVDPTIRPAIRAAAQKEAEFFQGIPAEQRTISFTQREITRLNNELSTLFKDPRYVTEQQLVSAASRNELMKLVDDAITSAGGEGWRQLRKEWGYLKGLERKSVAGAVKQLNTVGGGDFTSNIMNPFIGAESIWSLFTGNPAYAVSGMTAKGIQTFTKYMNNPDRAIRNMYQRADSIMSMMPKGKAPVMPRTPGSGFQTVGTPYDSPVFETVGQPYSTPVGGVPALYDYGLPATRNIPPRPSEVSRGYGVGSPKSQITNKIDVADAINKMYQEGVGPAGLPRGYRSRGIKRTAPKSVLYGGE